MERYCEESRSRRDNRQVVMDNLEADLHAEISDREARDIGRYWWTVPRLGRDTILSFLSRPQYNTFRRLECNQAMKREFSRMPAIVSHLLLGYHIGPR